MDKKIKVLMVCMGNICRSPLAEGILRRKVDARRITVDSAGTHSYHIGEAPCSNSQRIAQENGLDISMLRARAFDKEDFEKFDVIYAMDKHNKRTLLEWAENEEQASKVKLILEEIFPGEQMDVPDPYMQPYYAFKNIYKMLDDACEEIAQKYK